MDHPATEEKSDSSQAIVEAFVSARLSASAVRSYPGAIPADLKTAYAIQDAAINRWPDEILGWKVGGVGAPYSDQLGANRLAGPVFSKRVHIKPETPLEMPVFAEGFAAIEGEVTAVIAADAPAGKTNYTIAEAVDLIGSLHMGLEIASSPFAGINEHGPVVTISDFGNNFGLVLGDEIPNWRALRAGEWEFTIEINGETIGRASPADHPAGVAESVRFMLENAAQRGRPLKRGMMILTGAVTGVHQAYAGDVGKVSCPGCAPLECKLVPAEPI